VRNCGHRLSSRQWLAFSANLKSRKSFNTPAESGPVFSKILGRSGFHLSFAEESYTFEDEVQVGFEAGIGRRI
ncbi:MAG: hypothetical protein ACREP6_02130, partial [Candidatus Binataceae bacterium]